MSQVQVDSLQVSVVGSQVPPQSVAHWQVQVARSSVNVPEHSMNCDGSQAQPQLIVSNVNPGPQVTDGSHSHPHEA